MIAFGLADLPLKFKHENREYFHSTNHNLQPLTFNLQPSAVTSFDSGTKNQHPSTTLRASISTPRLRSGRRISTSANQHIKLLLTLLVGIYETFARS